MSLPKGREWAGSSQRVTCQQAQNAVDAIAKAPDPEDMRGDMKGMGGMGM
ncbi:MAG TPA: hypothetical protein VG501_05600 [Rhizomicrobium sp.]|nr:hypothetical protein [Rhizomicrobium sp.]